MKSYRTATFVATMLSMLPLGALVGVGEARPSIAKAPILNNSEPISSFRPVKLGKAAGRYSSQGYFGPEQIWPESKRLRKRLAWCLFLAKEGQRLAPKQPKMLFKKVVRLA